MKKIKRSLSLVVFLLGLLALNAQEGIKISVQVDGFTNNEAYLAYYYADKMYVRDTVQKKEQGVMVFEREEAIPGGIYLVVFPPDNNYFQILLKEGNESFNLRTTYPDLIPNMSIEGNDDNAIFYEYLKFIGKQTPIAQELKKKYATASEEEKPEIEKQQEEIDEIVKAYQNNVIEEHRVCSNIILSDSVFLSPEGFGIEPTINSILSVLSPTKRISKGFGSFKGHIISKNSLCYIDTISIPAPRYSAFYSLIISSTG